MLYYGVMGVLPCAQTKNVSIKGQAYKDLPVVEEIRATGRTAEAILPMAEQPVQVKVAAQGVKWQKDTFLTVVTNADGKQRIPVDSVFKDFPNAPLVVSVILTADEAQTTVHLEPETCEAIYTHAKK
jgi:hypothetical protein